MQFRAFTLANGKTLEVPTHVVRIDTRNTHGWQLRLGRSAFFSDGSADFSGAEASLLAASAELARRIVRLPAPTGLRTEARDDKLNGMPLGISGPTARQREGTGFTQYYLQVNFPVAGGKPVNRSVYIATDNTFSREKYQQAMAKAIALRTSGVRKFKLATTKLQREQAGASSLVR